MRNSILFLTKFFAITSFAQKESFNRLTNDQLIPVGLPHVKVGGEIGRRIAVTIEKNLLRLDIEKDFLVSFQKNDAG